MPKKQLHGHLGADALPMIQDVLALARPMRILEIGYNEGHSARMWLSLSRAVLVSIDIEAHESSLAALESEFGSRFNFVLGNSGLSYPILSQGLFDLVFIDGDHSEKGISDDMELSWKLGAKWLLIDDIDYIPVDAVVRRWVDGGRYRPVRHYSYSQVPGSAVPKQALLVERVQPAS